MLFLVKLYLAHLVQRYGPEKYCLQWDFGRRNGLVMGKNGPEMRENGPEMAKNGPEMTENGPEMVVTCLVDVVSVVVGGLERWCSASRLTFSSGAAVM